MALLQDLIQQINDPALRERILQETNKLIKQKKFGLVFEEHLPECTPLYDVPIRVGSKVARKTGYVSDIYIVLKIDGSAVLCERRETHEQVTFQRDEIVAIAEFGEPIYPTLRPLDYVENAPDSDLWHTLIEADNYHALQLLEYLYAEKVDCIYIDPPYNTGAKDWKYNNDYVDSSDVYRHSKWLSMMEKRLKIAKRLLKKNGAIITTIDDNEYANLQLLINQVFPDSNSIVLSIQMNPGGTQGQSFSVTNEYAIVTYFKDTKVFRKKHLHGEKYNLRRWGSTSNRYEGATCFYPIHLDKDNCIIGFGDILSDDLHPNSQVEIHPDGTKYVWPIDSAGIEKKWRYARNTVESVLDRMIIEQQNDRIEVFLRRETEPPKTMWTNREYNAEIYGTKLIKELIGKERFSYPKSLYAVKDCLAMFVSGKPNALIVDFFAGSGTTLHAVNLLNAEDNGYRQCILVTNNEVSNEENKILAGKGYKPGSKEWEKLGVARYVTWPRTVCSIKGNNVDGFPLVGTYGCDVEQYVEIEGEVTDPDTGKKIRGTVYKKKKVPAYPELENLKMSDGFKTNAVFFKLTFLDKTSVALGRQLKELLPVLWMKGGAIGKCPVVEEKNLTNMLILPMNKMAILIDEIYFSEFNKQIMLCPEIKTIFIITDSERAFREMIRNYEDKDCYQLYRDYLDNFRINTGR